VPNVLAYCRQSFVTSALGANPVKTFCGLNLRIFVIS
jgi:hypothetical protein